MSPMRTAFLNWMAAGVMAALATGAGPACHPALAVTHTGQNWRVHFNLPDQKTAAANASPDEFILRDAWLDRINALKKGDWAVLSTYTMSGPSAIAGAAGPMLAAVSNALARGAKVGWVVGNGVAISSNFWPGVSLKSLSARKTNPLRLAQAPKTGIMHNKMGVFAYAKQTPWVLSGSWNFTGGASSQQWNVLVELQNAALANACSNELSQLLAGHFHTSADKSHAWDNTRFRLPGWTRDGWIRFAPYPDGRYGGNNALTDITNAIASARQEIFFALNKLTREDVVNALVAACDRGVVVHGTIPLCDWSVPSKDSWPCVQKLLDPASYATANHVHLHHAYTTPEKSAPDGAQADLVHTKYMIIDPWGDAPLVIQGSANWTASALVLTSSNDENVQFLPDAAIAQAFVEQYRAMTDGLLPLIDSFSFSRSASSWTLGYWHEPGTYLLQRATSLDGPWTDSSTLPAARHGTLSAPAPSPSSSSGFFRLRLK